MDQQRKNRLLSKIAAARWRTMVRTGQLGDESLKALERMGLVGTPERIAREAAGIRKGNTNLMKLHQVTRGRDVPWVESATQGFYPVGDPAKIDLVIHAPAEKAGASPRRQLFEAIIERHEVDEARLMRKAEQIRDKFRKPSTRPEKLIADYPVVFFSRMNRPYHNTLGQSNHLGPKVIEQEAGHVNMGGIGFKGYKPMKFLRKYRGADAQQVNDFAGAKGVPYHKLPTIGGKAHKTWKREVQEEIRAGRTKERNTWRHWMPQFATIATPVLALSALGAGGIAYAERKAEQKYRAEHRRRA